jgi:adenosylhomocysteine nucleosidase
MGEARATLGVQAALAMGPVAALISVGLAGACDPAVAVGSVVEAGTVIDVRTGERFATTAIGGATLVTGPSLASVREKARLFAAYGAAAVDMEAATVARLALAHGIPFRAIKAISDDHAFELGALGKFETKHGHFHTRAFALHTAVRPHTWAKTIRLGKHSQQALAALTAVLKEEIRRTI